MLKLNLLTSCALALVSSASLAAADKVELRKSLIPQGAVPVKSIHGFPVAVILLSARGGHGFGSAPLANGSGATFTNLSKDKNAEFLSWYGYESVNYSYYSCSSSHCLHESGYAAVAIPITGSGTAVTTIRVPNVAGKFTVALYTNGQNNKPDNPIPGASGTASGAASEGDCCTQLVTVRIAPTTLSAATTYWLVEKATPPAPNSSNKTTWLGETTNFSGSAKYLVDVHRFYKNSGVTRTNYTSGWEGSNLNLSEPAAEVK